MKDIEELDIVLIEDQRERSSHNTLNKKSLLQKETQQHT